MTVDTEPVYVEPGGQLFLARTNVSLPRAVVPLGRTAVLAPSAEVAGIVAAGLLVGALPDGSFPDDVIVTRRCCGG